MITTDSALHQEVRKVMLARKVPTFDKKRQVTSLVREALESVGHFCRTDDSRLFFFSYPDRVLYDLDQRAFQYLLTSVSGLSATESGFRFLIDVLQADTARAGRRVTVHTLAHYDQATERLAVSDGGGGVWTRERGGQWSQVANGTDGLLFLTEPDAEPWQPEFGSNGHTLARYFEGFLLDNSELTADKQRTLLLVFLLQQFFPSQRRTRTIPAFLGPNGSGKTSAMRRIGRLYSGRGFDVTALHRDREDAFVAAMTNRTVTAIDNADSRVPWLEDALATYATGTRYRLRRLYSTNEEVNYEPRAILMISSRDPQFNRPDVAERLLPFHCRRPDHYTPEHALFSDLMTTRGAVMGTLLLDAGRVADILPGLTAPALRFRMADFAAFGWTVFAATGREAEWGALLSELERAQITFASDGDGLIETLRILFDRGDGHLGPISIGDLYARCRDVAETEQLPLPKNATSFGTRFTLYRRVIELELGARVHEERRSGRKRFITITQCRAGDGGDGGDGVDGKVSSSRVSP